MFFCWNDTFQCYSTPYFLFTECQYRYSTETKQTIASVPSVKIVLGKKKSVGITA